MRRGPGVMRHAASAHARCDARRLACSSAASLQAHTVCVGQPPAARALARARALLRGRGEGRSASRSHRAVPGAVPRLSTPSCAGGAPLEPTGHGAERPGALRRAELARDPGPGMVWRYLEGHSPPTGQGRPVPYPEKRAYCAQSYCSKRASFC